MLVVLFNHIESNKNRYVNKNNRKKSLLHIIKISKHESDHLAAIVQTSDGLSKRN